MILVSIQNYYLFLFSSPGTLISNICFHQNNILLDCKVGSNKGTTDFFCLKIIQWDIWLCYMQWVVTNNYRKTWKNYRTQYRSKVALTKTRHAHLYLSDVTGKTDYLAKNLTANTGYLKYKQTGSHVDQENIKILGSQGWP